MYRFRSTNLEQIVKAALKLKHDDSSLLVALEQAEDWLSRLKAMAEEVTLLRWWQELLFTFGGGGLVLPKLAVTALFWCDGCEPSPGGAVGCREDAALAGRVLAPHARVAPASHRRDVNRVRKAPGLAAGH